MQRKYVQISNVCEQIDDTDERRSEEKSERQISFWILNFRRRKSHVVPRVAREKRSDKRSTERNHKRRRDCYAAGKRARAKIGGDCDSISPDGQAEHDKGNESAGLYQGQRRLDKFPFANSPQIDPRENPD